METEYHGRGGRLLALAASAALALAGAAHADERKFGYVYEADVLPKGQSEFEQHLTVRVAKESGRYARWDFREEFEHGLTERLTTALYVNFSDEFSSGRNAEEEEGEKAGASEAGLDFTGISSEWKYQLASPYRDTIGAVLYLEFTTDFAHETELEQKLILSKNWSDWVAAFNLTAAQEWEDEDGETAREGELELTAGLSRKLSARWSAGLELRNHREFAESFTFQDEEHSAYFLGPNLAYANGDFWATLTVLPQIYGEGDAAEDHLILDEHERVEVRLLVGVPL